MADTAAESKEKKGVRMSQGDMPRGTLKEVVALAEALRDNFAGKDASGINLAKALDRSPTSSAWRFLTGAAVAYGLTDAAYNATSISLTPLGAKIVMPTEEGESAQALLEALSRPAIPRAFYDKYNGAKFPKDDIAKNVLISLGVPHDRADEALKILVSNAQYVGILTEAGGSQYVQLSAAKAPQARSTGVQQVRDRQVQGMGMMPQPHREMRDDGFHIPIVEEKMYIELPESVYKRSLLDDSVNDDLRALIKQAHAFAKKHVPQNEAPNSGESGES